MIFRLAIITATLAGCLALFVAHQYITVGYGLNPWVAVPVAVFCFGAALTLKEDP